MKIKYNSVRIRLLLYITVGIVLIISVYSWLSIISTRNQNKENEVLQIQAIYKTTQNEITILTREAMALAKILSDSTVIKSPVISKDYQSLRHVIEPIFQELRDKFGISHIYIHSVDEYVLFRAHAVDEYGDISSFYRRMLIDAKNKKMITGGIECDVDRLGIRGVSPILDNGKLIGLIEVGLNYDIEYLQELKLRTGIDYRMWVSYEATASSGFWPDSNVLDSPTSNIFHYASTVPKLVVLDGSLYDKVLQTNNSIVKFIESQGKSIAVLLAPIYGYNNQQIGVMELHKDRTERIVAIKYDQMVALLTSILLAVICICLMWGVIFRIILKPLSYLVQITQRRHQGDLSARTNMKHTDEFGQLGNSLDTLSDKLETMLNQQIEAIKTLGKTEKSLRESEESIRITLNSIGDAVISTDIKGRVERMNPTAEQLTGYSIDEAKGHDVLKIFNIINSKTRKRCENPIEKILHTGHAVGLANHTALISKDGTEYQIADSGTPIYNDEKELVGTVLVFHDVTGQYKLAERLHQAEKMQAIGQLAGGIAHDFNNMLGGIIGSAELLDTYLQKEQTKCRKYVHLIIETSKRVATLTDKLLSFSRKGKRVEVPVDLHTVIEDTTAILERSIDKQISIEMQFNAVSSIIIGDVSQLQNAILNLCVNARDAMQKYGKLTIVTENIFLDKDYCHVKTLELQPGKYVQITVKDTGHGIPQDMLKKIFEPFFTTKETGQGTGLGLAAVYGAIRDHHGDVSVYSELGKGSVFYVYLPVSEEEIQIKKLIDRKRIPGNSAILLIEDEEIIRKTTCDILKELGYEVFSAKDGVQGVKLYKENSSRIDLVILDMIMPKMSGEEAFNAIFSINPEVKIIITSGFSHDIKVQQLQAKNDNIVFIKKPFHASELSELIATKLVKR